MHTYKSLLPALLVVFFSPFAVADFNASMSRDDVFAEVARILVQQECNAWQETPPCWSLIDTLVDDAINAGVDKGVVIDALVARGVPASLASATVSKLASQTLQVVTTPKTSTGTGGASGN